jgi:membrane dipeptidase
MPSAPRPTDPLAHARHLLERFGLFDGHNDVPFVIREAAARDVAAYGFDRSHPETDTDLPRLREGRVSAQVFAAFVPTSVPHPARYTLEQIAVGLDLERLYPDHLMPARRSGDVAKAHRSGKIASILSVESGVGLENSISPLRVWHAAGVRILTLCHNETLDWIDSATDVPRHGGLTDFGRSVIAECNRLGIIVDLAHASHKAQHDALDVAKAPLLWSHSNALALCPHPRNVSDDVLDRVKANGGVVMVTFVPMFISRSSQRWIEPLQVHGKAPAGVDMDTAMAQRAQSAGPWPRGSITDLVAHIEHIVARTGLDHVGIGSDFYGGPTPPDLSDASRFPHLIAALVARGWSDGAIRAIACANAVRVWRQVERHAATADDRPGVRSLSPDPVRSTSRRRS